jgi:excisionase family DNA binding protein
MKGSEEATLGGMSTPIQWLSTADAAKYLGITPRTLYRFIDEGQIAGYRFGRVIRLKQSDVDLFIDSSRISPWRPGPGRQGSTTSLTVASGT